METQETPIIIEYLNVLDRNMTTIPKSIRNAIKKELGEDTVKGDSIKIAILGITKEGLDDLIALPIKIAPGEFKELSTPKILDDQDLEGSKSSSGATEILSEQEEEAKKIEKLMAIYNDPATSPETKEMVKNRLIELGALV